MARLTTLQSFLSVGELRSHYKVQLPRPYDDWRLMQPALIGAINGVPSYRGTALATNGIHVAILTEDGHILFGHLDFFIVDEQAATPKATKPKASGVRKSHTPKNMWEFI